MCRHKTINIDTIERVVQYFLINLQNKSSETSRINHSTLQIVILFNVKFNQMNLQ